MVAPTFGAAYVTVAATRAPAMPAAARSLLCTVSWRGHGAGVSRASAPAVVGLGARVHVYRNLHLPGRAWSVRDVASGRVVAHVASVDLVGVVFRVQPAGRARARREGRRNVHAYAAGVVACAPPAEVWRCVRYDPFGPPGFVDDEGRAVAAARWARFDPSGLGVS